MDPFALAAWPFTDDATCYKLALTDANDALALPIGGYFVHLVSTDPHGATLRIGASAAVPPVDDSTTAAVGMALPPGVMFTMTLREAANINGIMITGSAVGTLYMTKVR